MIKDCKIILNNEAVTVIDFDGIEVQFPHIDTDSDTVKVLYTNGKYEIAANKEPKEIPKPKKKKDTDESKEAIIII